MPPQRKSSQTKTKAGQKRGAKKTTAKTKTASKKAAPKKPSAKKPAAKKSASKKTTTRKTATKKTVSKKTSAKASSSAKPAAKRKVASKVKKVEKKTRSSKTERASKATRAAKVTPKKNLKNQMTVSKASNSRNALGKGLGALMSSGFGAALAEESPESQEATPSPRSFEGAASGASNPEESQALQPSSLSIEEPVPSEEESLSGVDVQPFIPQHPEAAPASELGLASSLERPTFRATPEAGVENLFSDEQIGDSQANFQQGGLGESSVSSSGLHIADDDLEERILRASQRALSARGPYSSVAPSLVESSSLGSDSLARESASLVTPAGSSPVAEEQYISMKKPDSSVAEDVSSRVIEPAIAQAASTDSLSSDLVGEGEKQASTGQFSLSVDSIQLNPDQPRKTFVETELAELSESIDRSGILQPLLVRPFGEEGQFEIVAGERRFRAARRVGLSKVPVVVKELSDQEAFELAVVENVQRSDLDPVEEALSYKRLVEEFGETAQGIAEKVGKDRATISNRMRILNLPESVLNLVREGKISAGHARALLMASETVRVKLAERVVSEGLSVRATERLASKGPVGTQAGIKKRNAKKTQEKSSAILQVEERLRRKFGTKVSIESYDNDQGELRISFFSSEEFKDLVEKLDF